MADGILHQAAKGISDLINVHGMINLDFADVETIMKNMGEAIMGTGTAQGDERAALAAQQAISSPLLDNASIAGAQGVLVNITGGENITLHEIDEATTIILEEAGESANIIVGAVIDKNMTDDIQVTVISTGFNTIDNEINIVDKTEKRLEELQEKFGDKIEPLHSDKINLKDYISECDLLIGGVLVPGSNAPKIITKDMIKVMKSGSVIVDVAIDQGGCVETSKPTTHANPTYVVDDVVHYCVANMPGGVPRTSTLALNAVTLPFIQNLASNGFKEALKNDKNFMNGLNIFKGAVTYKAIADDLNYDYANPETLVH